MPSRPGALRRGHPSLPEGRNMFSRQIAVTILLLVIGVVHPDAQGKPSSSNSYTAPATFRCPGAPVFGTPCGDPLDGTDESKDRARGDTGPYAYQVQWKSGGSS